MTSPRKDQYLMLHSATRHYPDTKALQPGLAIPKLDQEPLRAVEPLKFTSRWWISGSFNEPVAESVGSIPPFVGTAVVEIIGFLVIIVKIHLEGISFDYFLLHAEHRGTSDQ